MDVQGGHLWVGGNLRTCWVAGMRIRGANMDITDENSSMRFIQNTQNQHRKVRDMSGHDVDKRTHGT